MHASTHDKRWTFIIHFIYYTIKYLHVNREIASNRANTTRKKRSNLWNFFFLISLLIHIWIHWVAGEQANECIYLGLLFRYIFGGSFLVWLIPVRCIYTLRNSVHKRHINTFGETELFVFSFTLNHLLTHSLTLFVWYD